MQDATLVLRDIHQPPAPPWWPPAPGWWLVVVLVLALVAVWLFLARRRQRRRRTIVALFDDALARAEGSPAQIAAMSELLRRAARRRDRDADRLQGDAWLAFLDAEGKQRAFSEGAGRLLLEGGFRRDADPRDVAALRELARARFLEWMAAK
ncbi:MAG TPA: DUF4381 family protein [Lysobacter sp.]